MDATPEEEWRPVVEYEGMFEVSSHGRVRSLDRTITRKDGVTARLRGQMFNPYLSHDNYYRVVLRGQGVRVHTLVLEAFVGPRPDGYVACHNDGDGSNNHVSNLRWDTYSSNNFDVAEHGTHWQVRKTHCKNGHEFTPENTIHRSDGGRRKCRKCQYAATKRWMQRSRAEHRRA